MHHLYTWSTPNGRKASIMLEELGVPYDVTPVDITQGQSRTPDYLAINPHGRIPVLTDHSTGMTLFESGAILLYLCKKHGRFIGEGAAGWEAIQWVMWQMGQLGPFLGQTHHFLYFNRGKAPYAEERFRNLARGLYEVLDQRLADRPYIVGEYGVADIISFPWIARFERQEIDLRAFPNVLDWYRRIADRPAVQRGYSVPTPEPIPTA